MERLRVRETGRWRDDETEKQEDGEMTRQRNRKMVRWRERENEKQSNKERQIVT